MNLEGHMESLKTKHAEIEAQIAEETARPLPDDNSLQDLKRQKLKLKEEMEGIRPM